MALLPVAVAIAWVADWPTGWPLSALLTGVGFCQLPVRMSLSGFSSGELGMSVLTNKPLSCIIPETLAFGGFPKASLLAPPVLVLSASVPVWELDVCVPVWELDVCVPVGEFEGCAPASVCGAPAGRESSAGTPINKVSGALLPVTELSG